MYKTTPEMRTQLKSVKFEFTISLHVIVYNVHAYSVQCLWDVFFFGEHKIGQKMAGVD